MYLRDTGNKAKNTVVISMHCASSLLINQILKKNLFAPRHCGKLEYMLASHRNKPVR